MPSFPPAKCAANWSIHFDYIKHMGIQLYKKKDDICFPFSPGPLQACPSLQNMAYVYYTIYFPVLNFSFLFPLSFCEGVSETRLYWKQQDNGYLQVAAKIMRFSPRGFCMMCVSAVWPIWRFWERIYFTLSNVNNIFSKLNERVSNIYGNTVSLKFSFIKCFLIIYVVLNN